MNDFLLKQFKFLKHAYHWHWVVVVLLIISLLMTSSNALAKDQTVTNLADLQKAIQVDLINRETNFTYYYTGNTTHMIDNLSKVFEQAKQTNDYLNTSLTSWGYKVEGTTVKATIIFTVGYLTTKDQEDFIDSKIKALVPTLISSNMSDVAKEKAIHDWLIKNVAYDYTLNQRSAYTALTTGKTVCTGYAMLMNKMLDQVGIKNYIIAGHLSQAGSSIPDTEQENHVWNLVQIDNQWYHLDATNDWNNPDRHMFFNKGSVFMKEKGFSWSDDQLTRPVATPAIAESPEKAVDAPIVTIPAEGTLPVNLSEKFIRIINILDNLVTKFAEWAATYIQQLSIMVKQLLQT